MHEEALEDMELEGQQARGFLLNFKLLKDKGDPFLIFFTILSSVLVVFIALKLRIFAMWSEFLNSSLFLKLSTIPFLIAAIVVLAGLLWRTILWFRYKAMTFSRGEDIDWPARFLPCGRSS